MLSSAAAVSTSTDSSASTAVAIANEERRSRKPAPLCPEVVAYLKAWMMSPEHIGHPYPTDAEKAQIMADTGIGPKQLRNWFVNNRKRLWKPHVEKAKSHGHGPDGDADVRSLSPSHGTHKMHVAVSMPSDPATVPHHLALAACREEIVRRINEGCQGVYDDDGSHATSGSDEQTASSASSAAEIVDRCFAPSPASKKEGYTRREEVDVHILRPASYPLTLRNVTVRSSAKREDMLATFKCDISYDVPYEIENDRIKVQTRRDGEVLKAKKRCLRLYLAGALAGSNAARDVAFSVPEDPVAGRCIIYASPASSISTEAEGDSNPAPAKRARRVSRYERGEEEWRDLCQNASGIFCESLPDLDEAAAMFGYVSP